MRIIYVTVDLKFEFIVTKAFDMYKDSQERKFFWWMFLEECRAGGIDRP